MTNQFPTWASAYIDEWKARLFLCEWHITPALSPHPNEDASGNTRAVVSMSLLTRKATIDFLDQIVADTNLLPPDPQLLREWKKTIIHELLHLRFAVLEAVVRDDLATQLAPNAYGLVYSTWNREHETLTELLAETLVTMEDLAPVRP